MLTFAPGMTGSVPELFCRYAVTASCISCFCGVYGLAMLYSPGVHRIRRSGIAIIAATNIDISIACQYLRPVAVLVGVSLMAGGTGWNRGFPMMRNNTRAKRQKIKAPIKNAIDSQSGPIGQPHT